MLLLNPLARTNVAVLKLGLVLIVGRDQLIWVFVEVCRVALPDVVKQITAINSVHGQVPGLAASLLHLGGASTVIETLHQKDYLKGIKC